MAAVNRLAAALKEGIQRALTALGSLIDGALGLLERAYTAAIDAVAGVVQGAIRAAQAVVQFLGEFAALIRDIAGGPMTWLRNLGASVVDGLKNHVWRVLKCAVKEWFNSKVEAVLGLGRAIFDALRNGGIRFAEIGRMVWDALKAALPGIAIQLAMEKLLSLLVPAASAVMLIIDGLRAAWGAISRIIAAIEAFFRFLRAVKGGNAGRLFATALAAGAIALIDFLSNFLVGRLRGPASGVGGRLSGIAARLGRVGGAVARGARTVGGAVRRVAPGLARVAGRAGGAVLTGAQAVGRGVRAGGRAVAAGARAVRSGVARAARATGRGVVAGGRAVGRSVARAARGAGRAIASAGRAVGRRVAGAVRAVGPRIASAARATVAALARRFPRVAAALRRARAAWQRARARFREWRERRRQRRQASAQERLERAAQALRPRVRRLLSRGVSERRLAIHLIAWRLRFRLSSIAVRSSGSIVARVNPEIELSDSERVAVGSVLERILASAETEYFRGLAQSRSGRRREAYEETERIMSSPAQAGEGRRKLPPLHSADLVDLLRRQRAGTLATGQRRSSYATGAGGRFRIGDPTRPSRWFVEYGRPSHYAASRKSRSPRPGLLEAVQGQSPRNQAALMAIAAESDPGRVAAIAASLPSDIRSLGAHLNVHLGAIEPARAPGWLAATTLGSAVSSDPEALLRPPEAPLGEGRPGIGTGEGPYSGMTAASATGVEERRRGWQPTEETNRRHAAALAHRHASITRMFEALRTQVRDDRLRAVPGARTAALQALSEAFGRWLEGSVTNLEPEVLKQRAVVLTAAATAFLAAFHGDGGE